MSSAAIKLEDRLLKAVATDLSNEDDAEDGSPLKLVPPSTAADPVADLLKQIDEEEAEVERETADILARLPKLYELSSLYKAARSRLEELLADRARWVGQMKELGEQVQSHRKR